MKIKVKKEMRLDELIKWARENPDLSQGKIFFSTGFSDGFVRFHPNTNKCSTSSFIPIDIPFIVDIEKEVTEETKFDRLLEVYEIQEGAYMSALHTNTSIKERLENTSFPTKAFYILNDDMTMTLIWKDGELVE
ncbi:putative phage PVL protein [Staphylococcus aureus]|nr:putative phage PVL protein [Staphylococcus aureus]